MSPARLGYAASILTFAADQASKLYLLFGYDLPMREPVALGPFVNLIVVWNRGISYGLFQQGTEFGRWSLVVLSVVATIGLLVWVSRAGGRFLALALGLLAGGALGNAIDRAAYGAVFDFVQLHAAGYSWYVFNIADMAIVAGVVGLIYDSVILDRRRARPGRDAGMAKPSHESRIEG
ncbi:signal peptidase II [Enterovirga aerilata]|uniref:Lipoprotein signal peptidase n=1 Tax=Enterovirga aerilata TaxID=2730920 RepID=A0A849HYC1_9HYPH|nr:signal peptidase II [Enterovirga sp. DB1703]NNM72526.1 signal peptidase II [Enterovirga sp. DB1703]